MVFGGISSFFNLYTPCEFEQLMKKLLTLLNILASILMIFYAQQPRPFLENRLIFVQISGVATVIFGFSGVLDACVRYKFKKVTAFAELSVVAAVASLGSVTFLIFENSELLIWSTGVFALITVLFAGFLFVNREALRQEPPPPPPPPADELLQPLIDGLITQSPQIFKAITALAIIFKPHEPSTRLLRDAYDDLEDPDWDEKHPDWESEEDEDEDVELDEEEYNIGGAHHVVDISPAILRRSARLAHQN